LIDTWLNHLTDLFGQAQQALFEAVVQPLMFAAGWGGLLEDGYGATGWLLVGLLQIALLLLIVGPLQRWRPIEPLQDRAAVRTDVIYTLLHRLGLFRIALFFAVDPAWDALWGWLAVHGVAGVQLDQWVAPWWPGVTDTAWAAFVVYLLVFDLAEYGLHRAQHRVGWWWALHSLHHSQRQMTMWTDSRNHLLDDLLRDVLMVQLGHAIGVAPGQFVALVACGQLVENLSHANARLSFGWLGERLLVGPRFHRSHHAIGAGHESAGEGSLGGHNFAVLFPVWDLLFRSARYVEGWEPTGVRDQLPGQWRGDTGRDYGRGFWSQQWRGLLRLAGRA
jgi:sterol desaturase/sphingolipid hydroxylase (fatty acid hydroxylase superfamily)